MNAPVTVATGPKPQRSTPQNAPREVRAAYCYFHDKRFKNAGGMPFLKKDGTPNPRYAGSFMFPKIGTDPFQDPNYMWLWGLACEAAQKMWPQNVDAQGKWAWPVGALYAVDDGDVPYKSKPQPGKPVVSPEEIARKNAWRVGYWIVEANNFLDPGPQIGKVLGGTEVQLPARVINGVEQYKSGDWGVPNMHAYAYQHELGNFGVNFGFDGFCFTREGEAIGGGGTKSVQSMFGGVAGMVPQPGPSAPGAPSLPPAAPVAAAPSPPLAPVAAAPTLAPVAPAPAGLPAMPPAAVLPPLPPRPPGM